MLQEILKNIKKYTPNLYKKWVFAVVGIMFAVAIAGYSFVEYGNFSNSLGKYVYQELIKDYLIDKEISEKFEIDLDDENEDGNQLVGQEYVPFETTEENLQRYYDVYKLFSVLHLRKALNGYLSGTNEGIETPEAAITKKEDEEGNLSGLDAFDKAYYKSKFIVYDIKDFFGDGDQVTIIFQDKPDKFFQAWVYWNEENPGYYDLRGFWQLPVSDDIIKELMENDLIKSAMRDKEHVM